MIVVFGSIGVDIVMQVPRFARPGETIACDSYDIVPGTKGANQALAAARTGAARTGAARTGAARAGAAVIHVGTVGSDAAAETAQSLLREAGVDLSHVQKSATPTGTCMITVDAEGENTVIAASSANLQTRVAQLEAIDFGAGDTLVLQHELRPEETFAAIRLGRARGARIVMNAAPAGPVPAEILATLDLLIVNETEAEAVGTALGLPEADPEAMGRALHQAHGCATIVTLGAAGAVLWRHGERVHVAAPKVKAVDTTAAGDTFTGCLAAAWDQGLDLDQALLRGVVAGSLCCTRAGAQTSIPTAAEIDAAIGAMPA